MPPGGRAVTRFSHYIKTVFHVSLRLHELYNHQWLIEELLGLIIETLMRAPRVLDSRFIYKLFELITSAHTRKLCFLVHDDAWLKFTFT